MTGTSFPYQTDARGAGQRMLDALLDMIDRRGQGRPEWVDRARDILEGVEETPTGDDDDGDDSDRPPWAGGNPDENPHGGGGGGRPDDAGIGKGELYADQYIVFRDLDPVGGGGDGEPVLDLNGQPILVGTDGTSVFPVYLEQTADGDYEIPADMLPAVQEVELGRANLARAPQQVLDDALQEALTKIENADAVTTDVAGRIVVDGLPIDSPRENLALYQFLMTSGGQRSWPEVTETWPQVFEDLLGADPGSLDTPAWDPSALLGAAFNKEDVVSMDAMLTLHSILGINSVTGLPDEPSVEYFSFHDADGETYDYDRADRYADIRLQWYEDTDDDPTDLELVEKSVLEAVFGNEDWEDTYLDIGDYPDAFGTVPAAAAGVNDFAQAVEDARAVISFMHDRAAVEVPSAVPGDTPAPDTATESLATFAAAAPAALDARTTAEDPDAVGEPAAADEGGAPSHDHADGEDHDDHAGGHDDHGPPEKIVPGWTDDAIEAGGGRQHVIAGRGNDAVSGGGGADILNGGPGDDYVNGGPGRDLIVGREGDDILLGDRGPDRLFGLDGDDVLLGGQGCDTLRGGEGSDRFIYLEAGDADPEGGHGGGTGGRGGRGGGHEGSCEHADRHIKQEVIVDFEPGTDVIDFSLVGAVEAFADGPAANAAWAVARGRHTVLLADTDGDASGPDAAEMSIVMFFVTPEELGASDFLF